MRIEHPHIYGFKLDTTDFDPFWEDPVERIVHRKTNDDVIDKIIGYIEEPTRDIVFQVKGALLDEIDE